MKSPRLQSNCSTMRFGMLRAQSKFVSSLMVLTICSMLWDLLLKRTKFIDKIAKSGPITFKIINQMSRKIIKLESSKGVAFCNLQHWKMQMVEEKLDRDSIISELETSSLLPNVNTKSLPGTIKAHSLLGPSTRIQEQGN